MGQSILKDRSVCFETILFDLIIIFFLRFQLLFFTIFSVIIVTESGDALSSSLFSGGTAFLLSSVVFTHVDITCILFFDNDNNTNKNHTCGEENTPTQKEGNGSSTEKTEEWKAAPPKGRTYGPLQRRKGDSSTIPEEEERKSSAVHKGGGSTTLKEPLVWAGVAFSLSSSFLWTVLFARFLWRGAAFSLLFLGGGDFLPPISGGAASPLLGWCCLPLSLASQGWCCSLLLRVGGGSFVLSINLLLYLFLHSVQCD